MSKPENEKNRVTEEPTRREKKPYQKPAFEHEEVFETMALTCTQKSSTPCAASTASGAGCVGSGPEARP